MNSQTTALAGGLTGACALTLLHEGLRHTLPNAPRLDILGMRSIAKLTKLLGHQPPPRAELRTEAFAGDILSNAGYYSLAALGGPDRALSCGVLLGLLAGAGAVLLPEPLGLGRDGTRATPGQTALTIGLYTIGGLIAGAVIASSHRARSNDASKA